MCVCVCVCVLPCAGARKFGNSEDTMVTEDLMLDEDSFPSYNSSYPLPTQFSGFFVLTVHESVSVCMYIMS
jgi:hypothetical protein